jgi:hypothetical protein
MKRAILYVKTYNPHNHTQIPKIKKGLKPRKNQIRESQKFLGIDKIYMYITDMLRKIIDIPFLFLLGFTFIVIASIFGVVNIFIRK